MIKNILFTPAERKILQKLNSPAKIQDYLNSIPSNHEPDGDTAHSPRWVMHKKTAHCFEGALLAATALWYHGQKPLILDLVSVRHDQDHVVALFKKDRHWGAISKTNHAVLRYREPVYENIHELVMSYFHEYFLNDGSKTLRSHSDPFDLSKIKDRSWMTSEKNLWHVIDLLNKHPHYEIVTPKMIRAFRRADPIERKAGKLVEWKL